jgi:hypothetical protein
MWHNGMSTLLSKILNLPFNIPKALSINILVLDWIKFQCALYLGNPFLSPLNGEYNQGHIGLTTFDINL